MILVPSTVKTKLLTRVLPILLGLVFVVLFVITPGIVVYKVMPKAMKVKLRYVLGSQINKLKFWVKPQKKHSIVEDLKIPHYRIKINKKHLRKLQVSLKKASRSGILLSKDKDWYPIKFYHKSETFKAKIKIRGDYSNHWSGEKKSWRVKFNRNKLFQGRKYLDLIIPDDKKSDHVAYKFARKYGLLVPDSGYATVSMNAINMGLYFWLEKPSKQMLEKQEKPDGEIFRTGHAWSDAALNGNGLFNANMHNFNYSANFNPTIHKGDHKLAIFTDRWNEFLELVRGSDDQVFSQQIGDYLDLSKYYYWNAFTWLFGSLHSHSGDNLKWFYNSTTGKFEPMIYDISPRDVNQMKLNNNFESSEYDLLAKRLFKLHQHKLARDRVLYKLLSDKEKIFEVLEGFYFKLRSLFLSGAGSGFTDFLTLDTYYYRDCQYIKKNYSYLKRQLEATRVFLQSDLVTEKDSQTLNIGVIPDALNGIICDSVSIDVKEGVQIAYLRINDQDLNFETVIDNNKTTLSFSPIMLNIGINSQHKIIPKTHSLQIGIKQALLPEQINSIQLGLKNSITNTEISTSQRFIAPLSYKDNSLETIYISERDQLPRSFSLLKNKIIISKGIHIIDKNLVFDSKFKVVIEAGTTLLVAPKVSLYIQNSLDVKGSKQYPVKIMSLHPKKPFGNILVVNSPNKSHINHLIVSNGSESYVKGVFISGQLSFFHSDVDILSSQILNAKGDDGLNIKYSKFLIKNTLFSKNSSDAFDGDFVQGLVIDSHFDENSGDGIDTSGAKVLVKNCMIEKMVDKGISAGENSTLVVLNSYISGNGIGVASKDLSKVHVFNAQLSQNKIALSAYQKKQIFGEGNISIQSSLFTSNSILVDKDSSSKITIKESSMEQSSPLAININNETYGTGTFDEHKLGLLIKKSGTPGVVDKSYSLENILNNVKSINYSSQPGLHSVQLLKSLKP
ncbi:MAG: CotH kinase family protein [Candidatus Cloacimonetes bacterium]|nr:CotH kinase family protein [Candidatus Cloacimonadota bacterium]